MVFYGVNLLKRFFFNAAAVPNLAMVEGVDNEKVKLNSFY